MNRIDLQGRLLQELEDPQNGRTAANLVDLRDGYRIFGYNEDSPRLMASVSKLFAVGAVLERTDPTSVIPTEIKSANEPNGHGEITGDLYIVGNGDPMINSPEFLDSTFHGRGTPVGRIVDIVRDAGIRRISGGIVGDGSAFAEVGSSKRVPSSLSVDHAHGASPALTVAQTLTEEFVYAGIEVAAGAREGKADTDGLVSIGSIASPPMMDMLIHAGHDSDRKVIESLATIAAQYSAGDEGADEGVAELITQHARSHGAEVAVANASGLGQSNFAAPAEITNYLATVARSDFLTHFVRALPRAGQEGTLRDRMRNTAACTPSACQDRNTRTVSETDSRRTCQLCLRSPPICRILDRVRGTGSALRIQVQHRQNRSITRRVLRIARGQL